MYRGRVRVKFSVLRNLILLIPLLGYFYSYFWGLSLSVSDSHHYGQSVAGGGTSGQYYCAADMKPSYQVCNGFANQLVGHAAYISRSIQTGSSWVRIPDAFIVNGVQTENRDRQRLKDVLANRENSVPLTAIFDGQKLIRVIEKYGIKACFVRHDKVISRSHINEDCPWLDELKKSDDDLSLEVLKSLELSLKFSLVIENTWRDLRAHLRSSNLSPAAGICLHHRNGPDWINHCKKWKGNNCREIEGKSIGDLVLERIPIESEKKWVYYIGDEQPDRELLHEFEWRGLTVLNRQQHSSEDHIRRFLDNSRFGLSLGEKSRDIFAAVDFFTCGQIDSFIGNTVSTYSAFQIARRGMQNSTWYNSRSIPLAEMLRVYHIPFVYTYTEGSQMLGKSLLMASILSVRRVFGWRVEIHVLYHGSDDVTLLSWMKKYEIIVHDHKPRWSNAIQRMRQLHIDSDESHLLSHGGDYLGSWQRIDIPLFINSEYVLLLASDTIVHERFTLADFGLDITPGVAFSSELQEEQLQPLDGGVALFNVPKLRQTYGEFLDFIHTHALERKKFRMGPSYQGAYLDFYRNAGEVSSNQNSRNLAAQRKSSQIQFLNSIFSFKPYYLSKKNFRNRKIIHFHGLRPNDILAGMIGKSFSKYQKTLQPVVRKIFDETSHQSVCAALRDFSISIYQEKKVLKLFCGASFQGDDLSPSKIMACIQFFEKLASTQEDCGTIIANLGFERHISMNYFPMNYLPVTKEQMCPSGEAQYMKQYPDIRKSMEKGKFRYSTAFDHYLHKGKDEGRQYSCDILVSVIIHTFRKSDVLVQLLDSLLTPHDSTYEVILVDTGCMHETEEVAQDFQMTAESFRYQKRCLNQADSGSNYAAAKLVASKSKYLLFLDDDIVNPDPSFISNMAAFADYMQNTAVGCNLVDVGGNVDAGKDFFLRADDCVSGGSCCLVEKEVYMLKMEGVEESRLRGPKIRNH